MAGFVTVIASITKPTTILFMAASEVHPNANCKQQQSDKIWEVRREVPDEWSATLPLPDYVRFARDPGLGQC
jgi:hypothetical protein